MGLDELKEALTDITNIATGAGNKSTRKWKKVHQGREKDA